MERYVDTIALRKIMIEQGYKTDGSLADEAGISRATIGKILNQKAKPSTIVMDKLVRALNMNPETAGRVFFAQNLRDA